jgi:subtilisin family serine protease
VRSLRVALLVALAVAVLGPSTPADAGATADASPVVENHRRRQALLHRDWPDDAAPGALLVTTLDADRARAVAAEEHGRVLSDRVVLVDVEPGDEPAEAGRIAAGPGVLAVEPDHARTIDRFPGDPIYGEQWSHRMVGAEAAWDRTTGSSSVQVAILDSGIDGTHPDLADNMAEQVDVSTGAVVPRTAGSDNDACDVGHGTLVAGVAGAIGDNGRGVAGVAWDVSIVDVALSSPASRCAMLDSAIVAGLHHVSQGSDPVDVVNLSLGTVSDICPTAVQDAIDTAREAGVVIVASAGNDQLRLPGASEAPASCRGVISVASVGQDGNIAAYSSANRWVDLAAPGGDTSTGNGIVSTAPGGGYEVVEGTSFASPYVAGAVALLRSLDAELTPDEIEGLLERHAVEKGQATRDDEYGWGVLDLAATLDAAAAGERGAPAPDPTFPVAARDDVLQRISTGGATEPIAQAAAMSEATFDPDGAVHVVLARSDDFADALAGSSLGFGIGPLLFSTRTGSIAAPTLREMDRVLERGATVYVLGGTAALPPSVEGEIRALGLKPVRLAGTTREATAVRVAEELERFLRDEGFAQPPMAIVATRSSWPDAVVAGSFGAWFGVPILLTPRDSLDPGTSAFLSARSWEQVFVVGGTAAISDGVVGAVRRSASNAGSPTVERLAGVDRSRTAVAVARMYEELFTEAFGELPLQVLAVNLRRPDGFTHVLSASSRLGQRSGVFLPVEGVGGTSIDSDAQRYVCRFPALGIIVGGGDVITGPTASLVAELMAGDAPICAS